MTRRTASTERMQLQHLELLKRQLAELAASQRGATRVLPPQPSEADRT
ncbi:MAG: hypothetical protein JWM10_3685, partial [Myxococcaceae bacterium]|nr:hypothetical protein [Myxococcaceae bacterium]